MLHVLPVITLMTVAVINITLVFKYDLSAWHGGAFGMFSSVDHHSSRYIQITASTPQGAKAVKLEAYTSEIRALKNLPTPKRLIAFLSHLACTADLPAQTSALQLTYYKLDFTLDPLVAKPQWQGRVNACR